MSKILTVLTDRYDTCTVYAWGWLEVNPDTGKPFYCDIDGLIDDALECLKDDYGFALDADYPFDVYLFKGYSEGSELPEWDTEELFDGADYLGRAWVEVKYDLSELELASKLEGYNV